MYSNQLFRLEKLTDNQRLERLESTLVFAMTMNSAVDVYGVALV